MGNWFRREVRLVAQRGRCRWAWSCRGPVLIAGPEAVSTGTAVAGPGWCCGPDDGAQVMVAAAGSRIGHGVQEALWQGHELSMASGRVDVAPRLLAQTPR